MKAISTIKAPAAIGPYSQAIYVGNLVYTSGQLPIDPATGMKSPTNWNSSGIGRKNRLIVDNYYGIQNIISALEIMCMSLQKRRFWTRRKYIRSLNFGENFTHITPLQPYQSFLDTLSSSACAWAPTGAQEGVVLIRGTSRVLTLGEFSALFQPQKYSDKMIHDNL